jgi:hypothetical protein
MGSNVYGWVASKFEIFFFKICGLQFFSNIYVLIRKIHRQLGFRVDYYEV